MRKDDREWMTQALALGATAEGSTSPNPRVGCLLVRDGEVVGRGKHCAPGQPHAEALALADAGSRARGATLFVNLEPCAHHGRTPPCADQLVASGLARVVVGIQDPDPRVDGRGLALLRRAGIDVEVGLLADEAERLNEPFLHWHRRRLPLVTLKAACSLDGLLSASAGESRWITEPPARRFAHRLRLRHDAILVGAGTVRRDDPCLTVRLDKPESVRRRVVLSNTLRLDPACRVFRRLGEDDPKTRVYTSSVDREAARRLEAVADVVPVPDGAGGIDLQGILRDLADLGVQSVLVEGGATTFAGFVSRGLAQRFALFHSGKILGGRGGTPLIDAPTVGHPSAAWRVDRERSVALGNDLLWLGRFRPPRSD